MRVKKIGAILAGAVMIGSAVAAAWVPVGFNKYKIDIEEKNGDLIYRKD